MSTDVELWWYTDTHPSKKIRTLSKRYIAVIYSQSEQHSNFFACERQIRTKANVRTALGKFIFRRCLSMKTWQQPGAQRTLLEIYAECRHVLSTFGIHFLVFICRELSLSASTFISKALVVSDDSRSGILSRLTVVIKRMRHQWSAFHWADNALHLTRHAMVPFSIILELR